MSIPSKTEAAWACWAGVSLALSWAPWGLGWGLLGPWLQQLRGVAKGLYGQTSGEFPPGFSVLNKPSVLNRLCAHVLDSL